MMDIDKYYSTFSRLLYEDKVYLDPALTFSSICKLIGAPEADLDALIMKEMGISGAEMIRAFREKDWERIQKKYNLNMT